MVVMSEDSRKRKDQPTPEMEMTTKAQKSHDSVILAKDLHSTPVSSVTRKMSPRNLNLLNKCESMGLNAAKIDCEYLYELYLKLEGRVSTQEGEIEALKLKLDERDSEVTDLRAQLQQNKVTTHGTIENLEKQLQDLKNAGGDGSSEMGQCIWENDATDVHFLNTLKTELPLLSDHCARNEGEIEQLKIDLQEVKDTTLKVEEGVSNVNVEQVSQKLTEITRAQKDHQNVMIIENRRRHLEGDHRDQYTMRDCVRVTGVPFKREEDTNDLICRIAHSIGVTITPEDISVSHRTGRHMPNLPRAIICRFTRRDTKYQLLRNKKLTKNITRDPDGNPVRIFIDEKLTPMRARVCKLLREEKVPHHTQDGKIFITEQVSSEWKVLDTPEDWEKWEKTDQVKMDLGIYPKI